MIRINIAELVVAAKVITLATAVGSGAYCAVVGVTRAFLEKPEGLGDKTLAVFCAVAFLLTFVPL